MEIVFVRKVVDLMASALWDKYGNEAVNLFEGWTHLTITKMKEWQSDVSCQVATRIVGLCMASSFPLYL